MIKAKENKGFSIIELIIVVGVISILVVIGGSISSKFMDRRAIDKITNNISTSLNLAKIQAARHGVEYETVIEYDSDKKEINIKTYRGSSNTGTDFSDSGQYEIISDTTFNIMQDYTILPSDESTFTYHFNPNGTSSALSLTLKPIDSDTNIKKCGRIVLSTFGRVRTRIGNWDHDESDPDTACKAIGDDQASPPSSS